MESVKIFTTSVQRLFTRQGTLTFESSRFRKINQFYCLRNLRRVIAWRWPRRGKFISGRVFIFFQKVLFGFILIGKSYLGQFK